jgi:O-antigen ligase
MEDKYLTGVGADRARASHNTYFTMLVEHGIPGFFLYFSMIILMISDLRAVAKRVRSSPDNHGFLLFALPAITSMLAAAFLCDLFASYAKFEIRVWLLGALMALLNLSLSTASDVNSSSVKTVALRRRGRSTAPHG